MSCYRDLNPGPLPYQGSALPLSYNSKKKRAEDGAQTRDPQLGRLMLYQLSYFRILAKVVTLIVGKDGFEPPKSKASRFTVCPIWPLWYLPNFQKQLKSKEQYSNKMYSEDQMSYLCSIGFFLEPLVGFEPTTPRLQITCSGQLS